MCTVTKEAFIAYKAIQYRVVKLQIPVGSLTNIGRKDVVNPFRAMFRTNKALVLEIRHKETGRYVVSGCSFGDSSFQYVVGEIVEPKEAYDTDPDHVCASGIHFFLSEEAARDYDCEIINGLYQEWYDNGRLAIIGMNKNDKKDGEWKHWHKNGNRYTLRNYVDDKKSGLCKKWNEDGFLIWIKIYRDDRTNEIFYVDKHRMIVNTIDSGGSFLQRFRRDSEITPEEKENHAEQLLKTDNLVLYPDYIRRWFPPQVNTPKDFGPFLGQ